MAKKLPPRHQLHLGEPVARLRLTYTTSGAMRYTGNLDLHRIWERALRRARLPIAYSNGFHPQPRLQLACALPLGMTSRFELADLWLDAPLPPDEVCDLMNANLPAGIRIQRVEAVDLREKPLQTRIRFAVYEARLDPAPDLGLLTEAVNILLSATEVMRERRGKIYNLRPLIESLEVKPDPDRPENGILMMKLSAREAATGRPEEVLSAMDLDPLTARIERLSLEYD